MLAHNSFRPTTHADDGPIALTVVAAYLSYRVVLGALIASGGCDAFGGAV